jgi:hypothetical protein
VPVEGQVMARLLEPNVRVQMQNISYGGFGLTSEIEVRPGDLHVIRAVTAGGLVCTLRAHVVHCRPDEDAAGRFTSGWKIEPDPDSTTALEAVVDSLVNPPPAID